MGRKRIFRKFWNIKGRKQFDIWRGEISVKKELNHKLYRREAKILFYYEKFMKGYSYIYEKYE